ncbi:hypothetical protein WDV85_05220 [Pseudokineococcus sp. 5B2Z-1]|uniref:hypothetical protein n=1 Tax=Pseudokineococcus sp. 5B2Z-1 TaxID=3132744 RepID=UPI0030B2000F
MHLPPSGGQVAVATAEDGRLAGPAVVFRRGSTHARSMPVVPVLAIALVVYGVFSLVGASDNVASLVDGHGGAVAAASAVVAVLLLTASAALSVRWYARRAL